MRYLPAALLLVATSVAVRAADTDWSQSSDLNGIARSMNKMKVAAAENTVPATPAPSGLASTLSGSDLPTPEERAKYEQLLAANTADAESYLATRDYVRKSAAIVASPANKKIAMELKRPKNFDKKYLLAGEVDTVNAAVRLSLTALAESMNAQPEGTVPATPAPSEPAAAPSGSDLPTPEERAMYAQLLAANKADAQSYLATRDYVRKSAAVVASPENTKIALELKRPKNFDAKYLLAGDVATINAAVKLRLIALAESLSK